ncbi:MAG TPA: hypothetical protein VK592_07425 [Candidatus Dormibacteraeota bacterium]|nr:hypothetical protein [Candidatus Dormibacteraeota bacterium]
MNGTLALLEASKTMRRVRVTDETVTLELTRPELGALLGALEDRLGPPGRLIQALPDRLQEADQVLSEALRAASDEMEAARAEHGPPFNPGDRVRLSEDGQVSFGFEGGGVVLERHDADPEHDDPWYRLRLDDGRMVDAAPFMVWRAESVDDPA